MSTESMEFEACVQEIFFTPEAPKGEGWMLSSSVAVPYVLPQGFTFPAPSMPKVVHYWQRKKRHVSRECPNVRCRSIAFKDDKCIGCGAAVKS